MQVDEWAVVVWHDDGQLGVEGVVHLPDGSFVTPERVVVLRVLGVRVTGRGEDLVPRRGVGVGLWDTVGRLHGDREDVAGSSDGHTSAKHHLFTVAVQHALIRIPWRWQCEGDVHLLVGIPAGQADLSHQHGGVEVGDVTRVASEGPQWVQGKGDGHRDIDRARVLQKERGLGAGARLAAGHRAFGRGWLVQAVLESLILWYAEVNLVEAQKEDVPVLSHLWGFDLLDFEEVADGEEGDGHGADADHKDDQWRTIIDVAPQVLQRI